MESTEKAGLRKETNVGEIWHRRAFEQSFGKGDNGGLKYAITTQGL